MNSNEAEIKQESIKEMNPSVNVPQNQDEKIHLVNNCLPSFLVKNKVIDDDYFKMVLVFPITEENAKDKHINNHIAEKACLEVTKLIKVLKAHYTSHEYVDEDKEDKLVKYNILLFNFETYCYNMYDFSKLFYDGINVILGGYKEYHKLYDEIRATLPSAPIGFRTFDSNATSDNSQTINGHRIGFV